MKRLFTCNKKNSRKWKNNQQIRLSVSLTRKLLLSLKNNYWINSINIWEWSPNSRSKFMTCRNNWTLPGTKLLTYNLKLWSTSKLNMKTVWIPTNIRPSQINYNSKLKAKNKSKMNWKGNWFGWNSRLKRKRESSKSNRAKPKKSNNNYKKWKVRAQWSTRKQPKSSNSMSLLASEITSNKNSINLHEDYDIV